MKTTVPTDFFPTPESIQALIVWGAIDKRPVGDKLIDEEFITRKDIVADFICYWSTERDEKDNKRVNWQSTYRNFIKQRAWPQAIRDFEYSRHKRTDRGSGFKKVDGYISDQPTPVKPVVRKWKLPERPSMKEIESKYMRKAK